VEGRGERCRQRREVLPCCRNCCPACLIRVQLSRQCSCYTAGGAPYLSCTAAGVPSTHHCMLPCSWWRASQLGRACRSYHQSGHRATRRCQRMPRTAVARALLSAAWWQHFLAHQLRCQHACRAGCCARCGHAHACEPQSVLAAALQVDYRAASVAPLTAAVLAALTCCWLKG
jgi:hypothetical protein